MKARKFTGTSSMRFVGQGCLDVDVLFTCLPRLSLSLRSLSLSLRSRSRRFRSADLDLDLDLDRLRTWGGDKSVRGELRLGLLMRHVRHAEVLHTPAAAAAAAEESHRWLEGGAGNGRSTWVPWTAVCACLVKARLKICIYDISSQAVSSFQRHDVLILLCARRRLPCRPRYKVWYGMA